MRRQLELWHLIAALAFMVGGPAITLYVQYRITENRVQDLGAKQAQQDERIDKLQGRVDDVERNALRAQGETNTRLGNIETSLRFIVERIRR